MSRLFLPLLLASSCAALGSGCISPPRDQPGTDNGPSGGAAAGGSGSGGEGSGGRASGGSASGGRASGGATSGGGGAGGAASGGDGSGGTHSGEEFLVSFPGASFFGLGQPLAATPHDSMITAGPKAPVELFPEAEGAPFVVEYSIDGAVKNALAFPGAGVPELLAVDPDGNIFIVGPLIAAVTFGTVSVPLIEYGFYLLKMSPDFSVLDARAIELEGSSLLSAMAVNEAGDVVVGLGVYSEGISIQRPVIMKLSGETLEPLWTATFDHDVSQAYTIALTHTERGEVLAGGTFTGVLTVGDTVLTKAAGQDDPLVYNGWLAWLDPESGEPLRAHSFGGGSFDSVEDVKASDGRLLLLATHTSRSSFLDHEVTFDPDQSGSILYDFLDSGAVNWAGELGGSDNIANALAVGLGGESYVAGRFGWLGGGR